MNITEDLKLSVWNKWTSIQNYDNKNIDKINVELGWNIENIEIEIVFMVGKLIILHLKVFDEMIICQILDHYNGKTI